MDENASVAESPHVKRYALVPNGSSKGVRRFQLARVAPPDRVPDAQRLERMEELAARDRRRDEAGHVSQPGVD
jgi:hypothetical protein